MLLLNSFRRLRQSLRYLPASPRLATADDLSLAARRERTRADRSGGEYSLLTFAVRGPYSDGDALEQVAHYLTRRARLIDQFARTSDQRIWLILPDCPADVAVRIAHEICQQISNGRQRIFYDLFHYSANFGATCKRGSQHRQETRPHDKNESRLSASLEKHNAVPRVVESPLARATPYWKRALDSMLAGIGLICLSPLLLLVAALVKLTSRGPILFAQVRTGRSGRPFRMYKFRSMIPDADQRKTELLARNEQDGPAFKMENDPRITWVGRFLRATSIDELPQLWNVLRGQMSLVGPRPLPVSESDACATWQQERLDVTPGLTCLWQVCDRRSKIPFAEWMRMDIRYARSRSLALDLQLIARTIAFVIRRRGI